MANEEDMNLLLIRSLICDTNVHAGNIIKGHYTKIANTGITVSGYDSWQPPLDPDLLDEMAAYFYTKDIGKDPIPIVRLTPEGIEKAKEALSIYLENMKDIWIDEFGKMDTITEVLIRDYCFNQKEQPGRTPF
ncbi:MAG: hypothetical protein FP824_09435 [Euryarchaeota archaeon]|nr:hypothetical protein [Euryarchaeota archaeon]